MGRSIVAALVGYIVTALIVMISYSAAFMAAGPGFAFRPGSTDVSVGWLLLMFVVSLLAAVAGGYVASKVGKDGGARAVQILLVLVLVLGLISAFAQLNKEIPEIDPMELDNFEAANYAKQPPWFAFSLPVLGMVGVWFGGVLHRRRLDPA